MLPLLALLLSSFLLARGADILTWLQSEYPPELSKTLSLASDTGQLLANAGGRNIVLILPTDSAWEKHGDLYKRLQNDKMLSLSLIVDAAVEVEAPVKSLKEMPKKDLITIGGTPIIIDAKDKEGKTVYFGEFQSDGEVKKVGKPIKLKAKPAAVFDNITIFEATSFAIPPSLRSLKTADVAQSNSRVVAATVNIPSIAEIPQ